MANSIHTPAGTCSPPSSFGVVWGVPVRAATGVAVLSAAGEASAAGTVAAASERLVTSCPCTGVVPSSGGPFFPPTRYFSV